MPPEAIVALVAVVGMVIYRIGNKLSDQWVKRYEARKPIPREIQDEINQTQEWWDRQFAILSGEPDPAHVPRLTEELRRSNLVQQKSQYASGGYVPMDCRCDSCKKARVEQLRHRR